MCGIKRRGACVHASFSETALVGRATAWVARALSSVRCLCSNTSERTSLVGGRRGGETRGAAVGSFDPFVYYRLKGHECRTLFPAPSHGPHVSSCDGYCAHARRLRIYDATCISCLCTCSRLPIPFFGPSTTVPLFLSTTTVLYSMCSVANL